MAQTAEEAVDKLRHSGVKAGCARIRAFRPFPKEDVRRIARGKRSIGVVDRNISFGSEGIFFQETKSALCNEANCPPVKGFIAGLGGREVTRGNFEKMVDMISPGKKPIEEITWIGLKK